MSAGYLLAAIPEPFTVLGQRLKPFCLGHELLFQRFNISFAVGAEDAPEYSDLIAGVLICANTYEDGLDDLTSRWLPLKLRFWGWRCGNFDVGEKIRLFQDYIDAHTKQPEYTRDGGESSEPGAPFIQSLKVTQMSEFGMSESEALNTPFSVALWNYLTLQENKGAIHIVNDADRERWKIAADRDQEADAWAASLPKN